MSDTIDLLLFHYGLSKQNRILDEDWSIKMQDFGWEILPSSYDSGEALAHHWTLKELFSPHRIKNTVVNEERRKGGDRRKGERRKKHNFVHVPEPEEERLIRESGKNERRGLLHQKHEWKGKVYPDAIKFVERRERYGNYELGNKHDVERRQENLDKLKGQWEISGLKQWVFVPWRKGMGSFWHEGKGRQFQFKDDEGNYELGRITDVGVVDLPLPCEIVLQLHRLPCTIDFWMVRDRPTPSKPHGTITFDEPDDLLTIEELDPVLTQTMSAKKLMTYFVKGGPYPYRGNLELTPITRKGLPEMMRDYYSSG